MVPCLLLLFVLTASARDVRGIPQDTTRQGKSVDSLQRGSMPVPPDARKSNLPPDKASQTSQDIDITRRIRSAIVSDDSLSAYAHNVKIITKDGEVLLRGPVRSDMEKQAVGRMAENVVGQGRVRNEVEVVPQGSAR